MRDAALGSPSMYPEVPDEDDFDLAALLGGEEPNEVEVELDAELLLLMTSVVDKMQAGGAIEVEEDKKPALIAELTEAAQDARTPKKMISKVRKTLIASELPEEVYGTDVELSTAIENAIRETVS